MLVEDSVKLKITNVTGQASRVRQRVR